MMLAPTEMAKPGRVRPMLSRKLVVATYISIAGIPSAYIHSTRPPWRARSSLRPKNRSSDWPWSMITMETAPRVAAQIRPSRQMRPQSRWRPAPWACADSTVTLSIRPMPVTRIDICTGKAAER